MVNFHTVDGIVSVKEPPGFDWDKVMNPAVEGQLYYKGFVARYWRGEEKYNEQNYFTGDIANIHQAAFVMEGNNLQELTQDFHEMVDDFLEEVDNGGYGGHPIEYYTNDPDLLAYYKKHHRRNVVQLNPYRYEEEVPFRMAA
jgi:hypothetical protein